LSTHAKNGKEYVMPYINRYKKILWKYLRHGVKFWLLCQ
jgi:hypothetical protein